MLMKFVGLYLVPVVAVFYTLFCDVQSTTLVIIQILGSGKV